VSAAVHAAVDLEFEADGQPARHPGIGQDRAHIVAGAEVLVALRVDRQTGVRALPGEAAVAAAVEAVDGAAVERPGVVGIDRQADEEGDLELRRHHALPGPATVVTLEDPVVHRGGGFEPVGRGDQMERIAGIDGERHGVEQRLG
jgi:hypothetical protein